MHYVANMRIGWLCIVIAGCNAGVSAMPTSLRIAPEAIDLAVDLALPAPAASVQVFEVDPDGSEHDVTADAALGLDGAALGTLAGATLTSDGITGGVATLRATYAGLATAITATAHVHGLRTTDGTAFGAHAAFTAATHAPVDAHLDPGDGAVIPANLGRMVLAFAAADSDDTHQVRVAAPYLDLEILAPGVAGPRTIEFAPNEWAAIARTAGGQIQLDVASLASSAPAEARVESVQLEIAQLAAGAVMAGGANGALTDTVRSSLWRYDMGAGALAQIFAPADGTCFGCHLAVSPDGKRVAVGMVTPASSAITGVVLDAQSGTIVAQSGTADPWATAAFDPEGRLVAAYQGALSLRDGTTGATLAPIALGEAASAPAVAPDGSAIAYVSLDAGLGDAATQPIGNALHLRVWNAAAGTVGPVVELFRNAAQPAVLPTFSSDGRWVAFGQGKVDPDRLNEEPTASAAVRTDGSGALVQLTTDPLDQLAHFASPVGVANGEPMVWVAFNSGRLVGGNAANPNQLWLEAFYPDRGVVSRAFHLPGQPAAFQMLHGPIALP